MDTATAEYLFCCDFFQEDTIFTELFAATLSVVESAMAASLQVRSSPVSACQHTCEQTHYCGGMHAADTALVCKQDTYDLVGLLLMIRVNYHHQLVMNKRRIPCLDDYLDRVNLLLWPRFKVPPGVLTSINIAWTSLFLGLLAALHACCKSLDI